STTWSRPPAARSRRRRSSTSSEARSNGCPLTSPARWLPPFSRPSELPPLTLAALRKQIASGETAPVYLLVGEDDAEKSAVAGEFAEAVDEGLRAFNVDRLYGGEVQVARLIDDARTLPLMAPRRIIVV